LKIILIGVIKNMSTDAIILQGADQLLSQWEASFPGGIPTGGNDTNVALRVDTSFTPPAQSVGTYTITKKGITVPKTNTQTGTTKTFSLEWRVDQDWQTFDDMKKWFDAVYDQVNGVALPDISVRGTVLLTLLDTQNNVKKKIRFKNVKPTGFDIPALDNASQEPMRCVMHFIYVDFIIEA
jgi:hypothetical protein